MKPSRSDEVLDAEQQIQIAGQVRAQFDSMGPKRPTKPNRSEPDSTSLFPTNQDVPVPEFDKFRSLRSQSHQNLYSGAGYTQEEFVETEYYKQLDSIDKQHHTTGSGFIKVLKDGDDDDGCLIQLQNGEARREMIFKTNPATNDWIPRLDDQAIYVSAKPKRSESD